MSLDDDVLDNLMSIAKKSLSIISTATAKDDEIEMQIKAGILDMERQGILAIDNIEDELIKATICMFVKAHFGMTNINEKELAERTYKDLCGNLSLSSEYTEATDE